MLKFTVDNIECTMEKIDGSWWLTGCDTLIGYSEPRERLSVLWDWATSLPSDTVYYGRTRYKLNDAMQTIEEIEDFMIEEFGIFEDVQ